MKGNLIGVRGLLSPGRKECMKTKILSILSDLNNLREPYLHNSGITKGIIDELNERIGG